MIKIHVTVYCTEPGCERSTKAELPLRTIVFRGAHLLTASDLPEFPPDEHGDATGWTLSKCPDHRVKP